MAGADQAETTAKPAAESTAEPTAGALARRPWARRAGLWLLATAVAAALIFEARQLSFSSAAGRIEAATRATAQARALGLSSEIARQQSVAAILAEDRDVIDALAGGAEAGGAAEAAAVSAKLEGLLSSSGSSVIYVVDAQGAAIAASNWRAADSFVGSNYAFRDYFTQAMETGEGWEYALGSVSHRPGLYLSRRVIKGDRSLGVVIVKLDFADIEAGWRAAGGGATLVADAGGRITLTSNPALRFQPAPALGADRLAARAPVAGGDWQLVMTASLADARRQAALNAALAALALALCALAGAFAARRGRRARARAARELTHRLDLEREVAERTRALSGEIREREGAERRLASMQARLVQANRLAALGQITAGVAHEVNQPLATIRLLAENAQAMLTRPGAGTQATVDENLTQIVRMSERIDTITSELRGFSRKARGGREPVSLAEAWEASLLLSASRRVEDRVRVTAPRIDPRLMVVGEKVRIEQVMVNLLQNAHEALSDAADPEIRVSLRRWTGPDGRAMVTFTVADNGPGLAPGVAENLFSPFLTTKREGLGLGLVISQGIMREVGGRLYADPPAPGRGARFNMDLEVAP